MPAFVNPHHGSAACRPARRRVAATDPRPHRSRRRGRSTSASSTLATATHRRSRCWSTACCVHAWYADGLGPARPVPRRLGDQVRAGPPGRARRAWTSTATVDAVRARAAGVPRGAGARRRAHDQRRGLGGRPSRPRRPGHRARRGVRDRRLVACRCWPASARGTRRAPATPTARPTPRCSTGCANAPRRCRLPRRLAELWRDLGCTEDAVVAVDGDGVALAGGGVAAAAGDWARIGLLQLDGAAPARLPGRAWVEIASRPSLPFLRPGRLPAPLSTHVGFGYHWWPLDDARHARGRRRQPRPVRLRRPPAPRGRREDLGLALRRRRHDAQLPRPELPHAPRSPKHRSGKGWPAVNRKVIITCALTGAGDTVGKSEHVPVTPAADRRLRHRRRPRGRGHRARPRARPPQRPRLPRRGALPRGGRPDPRQRRRRRDQHDGGHGRRPLPRPGRPVRVRRGHRPRGRHRRGSRTSKSCARTSARSTAAA